MSLLPSGDLKLYPDEFFRGGVYYLGDRLVDWWLSNIAGLANNPGGKVVSAKVAVSISKRVVDISVACRLERGDGYSWKWFADGNFNVDSNAKTITGVTTNDYQAYQYWRSDGKAGPGQWKLAKSLQFVAYGGAAFLVPRMSSVDGIPGAVWSKHFASEFNYDYITKTNTAFSAVSYELNAKVVNLVLTGSMPINAKGNSLGNSIVGNSANNILDGGDGSDQLTGLASTDSSLGKGSIDVLIGGEKNDRFILGRQASQFYSDGNRANAGRSDYALISDYAKGDQIQLPAQSAGYQIKPEQITNAGKRLSGFGLYLNDGSNKNIWDSTDELIGFIQVVGNLVLNNAALPSSQGYFVYV